nr:MAG TPA: hypothetical protein [Caudoviricetes sp.]
MNILYIIPCKKSRVFFKKSYYFLKTNILGNKKSQNFISCD